MDCIVHGVAKSWIQLSNFHFTLWQLSKHLIYSFHDSVHFYFPKISRMYVCLFSPFPFGLSLGAYILLFLYCQKAGQCIDKCAQSILFVQGYNLPSLIQHLFFFLFSFFDFPFFFVFVFWVDRPVHIVLVVKYLTSFNSSQKDNTSY